MSAREERDNAGCLLSEAPETSPVDVTWWILGSPAELIPAPLLIWALEPSSARSTTQGTTVSAGVVLQGVRPFSLCDLMQGLDCSTISKQAEHTSVCFCVGMA